MNNLHHSRTLAARLFVAALLLASGGSALAGVHYVDVNSTNATPPYTNWTSAATNIQDAVDAAVTGDEIVVTNGTYHPVAANKPLSLRSVNGPQSTIINGGGSGRCVYLTNKCELDRVRFNQWIHLQPWRWGLVSIGKRGGFQLRDHGQRGFYDLLLWASQRRRRVWRDPEQLHVDRQLG